MPQVTVVVCEPWCGKTVWRMVPGMFGQFPAAQQDFCSRNCIMAGRSINPVAPEGVTGMHDDDGPVVQASKETCEIVATLTRNVGKPPGACGIDDCQYVSPTKI